MEKIILYYKFTPVQDPEMTMRWQRELCTRLNLKGRVLIAKHGINGTLGGKLKDLKAYKKSMNESIIFKDITYKWSDGSNNDFPKLKVKVKPEIVAFDAANEITVTEKGITNGGKHLKPEALHKLVEEKGDEVIFYDGRNMYEAEIGRFKNTIIPKATTSRDFKKDIEEGEISKHKDKPIVTYCTGGITKRFTKWTGALPSMVRNMVMMAFGTASYSSLMTECRLALVTRPKISLLANSVMLKLATRSTAQMYVENYTLSVKIALRKLPKKPQKQ